MSEESEPKSITPAQQEALEKAYSILGEHFEGVLMAVSWETESDEREEASRIFWAGGYVRALGLAELSRARLTQKDRTEEEP